MDGRKARGQQRRDELMAAAVTLVAHQGITAVTHRAVASAAGHPLASVTYHFPNATDLKNSIFAWAGERMLAEMGTLAAQNADAHKDPAELAGDFAFRLCTDQRDLTIVMLQLLVAAGCEEGLRPIVDQMNGRSETILSAAVGDDAPVVVASIQGIMLLAIAHGAAKAAWAREAVHDVVHRYQATTHHIAE